MSNDGMPPTQMSLAQGHIDAFTDDHVFVGWARSSVATKASVVSVRVRECIVARAIAEHYRRDLLEARIGHGHYAFRAKFLNNLPFGEHTAQLWDDESETPFKTQAPFVFSINEKRTNRLVTCDDMLKIDESWDDETLSRNLHCLRLEHNLRIMGYDRFINLCFLYILGRTPEDAERTKYRSQLSSGKIAENQLFNILLLSDERKKRKAPLVSPYDPRFPFALEPRDTDAVHSSISANRFRSLGFKKNIPKKILRVVKPLFRRRAG